MSPPRRLAVALAFAAVGLSFACGETLNPPILSFGGGAGGGGGPGESDAGEDGGTPSDGGEDGGVLPDGGTVSYTAEAVIGGLDRIRIFREQLAGQPRCTVITIVSPASGGTTDGGLTLPPNWALQNAYVKDRACAQGGTITGTQTVSGEITFNGTANPYPTSLNVHATAFFTAGSTGFPPASVQFDQDNVPVP